jgi:6-pyruvoyltetrahydropterin/6-carboxytetrahydropterin synthase
MSYRITKTFEFDAAHHLPQLPEGHKCRRPHGHTYRVTITAESDALRPPGFVEDYGDYRDVKEWIAARLDHRDLNQVCPYPTTAENLARWLYGIWLDWHPRLVAVMVQETPHTSAEYRP